MAEHEMILATGYTGHVGARLVTGLIRGIALRTGRPIVSGPAHVR